MKFSLIFRRIWEMVSLFLIRGGRGNMFVEKNKQSYVPIFGQQRANLDSNSVLFVVRGLFRIIVGYG